MTAAGAVALALAGPAIGSAEAGGNGVATPFKSEYTYVRSNGSWAFSCSGAHVENRNHVKDDQTCVITPSPGAPMSEGAFSGAPTGLQPYGITTIWLSDFDGTTATSWTMASTANGDGTYTVEVESYYPRS
jgi:hypothetical protein